MNQTTPKTPVDQIIPTSFAQMDLIPEIDKAIKELGFETATQIQAESIPLIRMGKDIIGRSQTGTGKTIAFGIPAIEKVDTGELKNKPQVIILCPTRELAVQGCKEIKKLSKYKEGINAVEVYGGAPMDRQILKLKKANIVIGTPGRIMDHMRRKTLKLQDIKMVVLDEADEMLSMGFREDIETILADTPQDRQTVLFSATMPPAILKLTKEYQTNPQIVSINSKEIALNNIEQTYYKLPLGKKQEALNVLLQYYNTSRTIIFTNTKKMVEEITEYLNKNRFSAEGIHGDLKQSQRQKVMDAFKAGIIGVLVATDVAARGIDVSDVDYVINYDIPQNPEYYVHRIGRTGRAGKSGKAITLCCGNRQMQTFLQMAREVKANVAIADLPNSDGIRQMAVLVKTEAVENVISAGEFDYADIVKSLVEKGHTHEEIALAALQMRYGKPKKEINLDAFKERKESRRDSGRDSSARTPRRDSARDKERSSKFADPTTEKSIKLSVGKNDNIGANHIVGAITELANISGKDIGKIQIKSDFSIVNVPGDAFEAILSCSKNLKICGIKVNVNEFYDDKPASKSTHQSSRGRYGSENTEKKYSSKPKIGTNSIKRDYKPRAKKDVNNK